MSEGDLLKIKLQMLQFQMDVSAARLARVQALASLRQFSDTSPCRKTTKWSATSNTSR